MTKLIAVAALFVAFILIVPANARDDGSEPSEGEITEYAFNYMKTLSGQKLSDREIASQLASTIFWSEKNATGLPDVLQRECEAGAFRLSPATRHVADD